MYNLNNNPNTKIEPILLEAITNQSIFFIGCNYQNNVWRINNKENTEVTNILHLENEEIKYYKVYTSEIRELITDNTIKYYKDLLGLLLLIELNEVAD